MYTPILTIRLQLYDLRVDIMVNLKGVFHAPTGAPPTLLPVQHHQQQVGPRQAHESVIRKIRSILRGRHGYWLLILPRWFVSKGYILSPKIEGIIAFRGHNICAYPLWKPIISSDHDRYSLYD